MLLEALLIWNGAVSAEDLGDCLDCSIDRAEQDLARYRALHPGCLIGDAGTYRASDQFEPSYLRGTVQEFLQVLRNVGDVAATPLSVVAAQVAPIELLQLPERAFDVRILQRMSTAIRDRRWLEVEYQSMSHPEPRSLRIAPHALAHAGRWHARAWSETHQAYRDFLLSRISGIPQLGDEVPDRTGDWEWSNLVSVRIGPHAGLSPAQQRVVEQDYGMRHGMLETTLRLALVPYYLRMMGVGRDDLLQPAAEQQIMLLNGSELASYDRLSGGGGHGD